MPAIGGRVGSSAALLCAALISVATLAGCAGLVSTTSDPTPPPTPGGPPATDSVTPAVSPTPIGGPSDATAAPEGWLPLAQAPDAVGTWSTDAAHVLVGLSMPGGPPEAHGVRLMTRDGQQVSEFEQVTDPVWIDDERFVAYRLDWRQDESGAWFAETGPNGERLATVLVGTTTSDGLTESELPVEPAISNGGGALAVTRFDEAGRAEFAVWENDAITDWRPGQPMHWSTAGDRLAVIHSSDSGPAAEGWLEVVEWPGLSTTWSSDPALRVADARFDPSGHFIAYAEYLEQPTQPRQPPAFDLIVRIVALATGDVGAFKALENGDFAWDAQGELIVVGFDSHQATWYDRRGTLIAQEGVVGPNVIASADGSSVLFYDAELDRPPVQVMRGGDLRVLGSPGTLAGPSPRLAPDGSGLLVVVRLPSSAPQGPPATVLLHRL